MIRPPSDLVMDVVRAADPARAAAVSQRLAQAGQAAGAGATASFDAQMRLAATKPLTAAPPPTVARADSSSQVGRGLEELMMRRLLEDALPKDAASVYGAGSAGSIWRSFFAEHLAHALSQTGRIGLASRLVQTAPLATNAGGKA